MADMDNGGMANCPCVTNVTLDCNIPTTRGFRVVTDVRTAVLGPIYMEKSCPGKEGHTPSRVNFSEHLYEKKVDPFAQANTLTHTLIVSP